MVVFSSIYLRDLFFMYFGVVSSKYTIFMSRQSWYMKHNTSLYSCFAYKSK